MLAHLIKHRGRPLDCRENVMYALQLDQTLGGLVRQNDFTHLIERVKPTPWGHPAGEWNEEDDLMLGEYLLRNYGMAVKATSTLRNGVLMAARSNKYNPVLELLPNVGLLLVLGLGSASLPAAALSDIPRTRLYLAARRMIRSSTAAPVRSKAAARRTRCVWRSLNRSAMAREITTRTRPASSRTRHATSPIAR